LFDTYKMKYFLLLYCIFFIPSYMVCFAQKPADKESFFEAKKRSLIKKIGKSLYRANEPENPIKSVNPFLPFKGKTIRTITIAPTGFHKIVNDSLVASKNKFSKLADAFHRNTLPTVIRKNLFFKEGDQILPLLLADNERYLRELSFVQDALIVVESDSMSIFADIIIVTKDVFSLGGSVKISGTNRAQVTVKDENVFGTGNKIEYASLYDIERVPRHATAASFTQRNIKKSFINWSIGFKTFNPAFNSGRLEEKSSYTILEKPLVSRYDAWTGAAAVSFNETNNAYIGDSLYRNEFQYKSVNADMWAGYNIGHKIARENDSEKRLRHFVAMRSFYKTFYNIPDAFKTNYNYNYANLNGLLTSYSLYKQNFYRTNFIYGFGRNEDVPDGINATVVGGYTNKQGIKRAYFGLEFDASHYEKKGVFTSYTLRAGSFVNRKRPEDADVLLSISRFTKLTTLSSLWRNRNFISLSYTRQFNSVLNGPLLLESNYGLPYFRNNRDVSDTRSTIKFESVFYHLKKFFGFRFAPFLFTDLSLLKPLYKSVKQTKGFTALGGGVRTRNENLVFGTVELKGYVFPRVYEGMRGWKIELSTNIRFKYNSSFIRRPDFIIPN
jgi:hypothetical protein